MQKYPSGSRLLACCILTLIGITCFSQDKTIWAVNLQKEYSKSYPLGTDMVHLSHAYGDLRIETWDKDEVKLEAQIAVSAQQRDWAQELLDAITIKDEKSDGVVKFVTLIQSNEGNRSNHNGGHEMRINWVLHLPSTATLYALNRFGAIKVGDYKGVIELQGRYGTITTGDLTNRKLLQMEFGNIETGVLSDSTRLVLKYSKANIGSLTDVVKAELQYSNSVDLPLGTSLRELNIQANYSSIYLLTPKDFSASYDITTTYATASAKGSMQLKEMSTANASGVTQVNTTPRSNNVLVPAFSPTHRYAATTGNGNAKVEIKSNYGNVRVL